MTLKFNYICNACDKEVEGKPFYIKGFGFHRKIKCIIKYFKVKKEYHKRMEKLSKEYDPQ